MQLQHATLHPIDHSPVSFDIRVPRGGQCIITAAEASFSSNLPNSVFLATLKKRDFRVTRQADRHDSERQCLGLSTSGHRKMHIKTGRTQSMFSRVLPAEDPPALIIRSVNRGEAATPDSAEERFSLVPLSLSHCGAIRIKMSKRSEMNIEGERKERKGNEESRKVYSTASHKR